MADSVKGETDDGFILAGSKIGTSLEAVPQNLNLHSTLPTQVGVIDSRWAVIQPERSIENQSIIDFEIRTSSFECLDVNNTYLRLEYSITKADGTLDPPITENAQKQTVYNADKMNVFPINGISHSLFKGVNVKINDQPVATSSGFYMYRGNLDSMLNWSESLKKGELHMSGFDEERPPWQVLKKPDHLPKEAPVEKGTKEDKTIYTRRPAPGIGDWLKMRQLETFRGRRHIVVGRIFSEIFDQPKPLPCDTKLSVSFDRIDHPKFVILANDDATTYKIHVHQAHLIAHYIKPDPAIIQDMIMVTKEGNEYKYPVKRVDIKGHNYGKGERALVEYNLFKSGDALPRRIFACMVHTDAFNGVRNSMDPFHYDHFNIEKFLLRVGGDDRPFPEVSVNCAAPNYNLAQALFCMYESTGVLFNPLSSLGYDWLDLLEGKFIMGFDLSNSKATIGENFELPVSKTVDLEIHLREPADHGITVIVMAEYDAEITIDRNGLVRRKFFGGAL